MTATLRTLLPILLACTAFLSAAPALAQNAPPTTPSQEEMERQMQEAQEEFRQAMEQLGEDSAAAIAGAGVAFVTSLISFLVFGAVFAAIAALLIFLPYSKVPAEHQQMSPPAVWLLVIPLFNYIWSFLTTAKVSASFKSYFDSIGDTSVGDAGKTLGLWFSICFVASFGLILIPCLGWALMPFVGLAALILLILYIVKLFGMSGRIETANAAPPSAPPSAPPPAA